MNFVEFGLYEARGSRDDGVSRVLVVLGPVHRRLDIDILPGHHNQTVDGLKTP
jgi:hypothetical protein